MSKVKIYQWTRYCITTDEIQLSRRWGTREAIERRGGAVVEETGVEVDASVLGREHEGLTDLDYDPRR